MVIAQNYNVKMFQKCYLRFSTHNLIQLNMYTKKEKIKKNNPATACMTIEIVKSWS